MNKDVIYVDVEDDITAIIDKVKSSQARIVALVPPKRIGVLQSAVNLRLLNRAAESSDKRLVLISNSEQLQALAATVKIPVAKNLQTKPEVPVIPELDSLDDEMIDGANLPVGELARTVSRPDGAEVETTAATTPVAASTQSAPTKAAAGKKVKVPNFNSFRKKLLLFGSLGVLLIGFFVWAVWFAPRATIVIAARTVDVPVSLRATLSSGQATDFDAQILKVDVKETSRETSVEFEATGEEDRGSKASGQINISISCSAVTSSPPVIPAGTEVSSGGKVFITQSSISVSSTAFNPCRFVGSGSVVAAENGESHNLPNGAAYSVKGYSGVTATGSAMTGGVSNIVKIVTAADMQTAREKLVEQNTDAVKDQLKESFGDNAKVIDSSFVVTPEEPQASAEVGEEAPDGKAKLTSRVHYRIGGIQEAELEKFLKAAIESRLNDDDNQKVYETGIDEVRLADFRTGEGGDSIAVSTNGRIGPDIDEDSIKEQSKNRRYGEVQSSLESRDGISSVDVEFWPFWVRTVPGDVDKISLEFKLENND